MKMCDICGKKEATIHRTEIINNQKIQQHLCDECAEKNTPSFKPISMSELLGGLIDIPTPKVKIDIPDIQCRRCGITYQEFQAQGRFGCANDINIFKKEIIPLIEKIHVSSYHCGKMPKRTAERVKYERRLLKLNRDLDKAVEKEDYEQASKIRDTIKEIEELEKIK